MPQTPNNPDEIGALWMKAGPKGDYMTGTVNGVKIVVFRNDRKVPGSQQPDWRVLISRPRGESAPHESARVELPPERPRFTPDVRPLDAKDIPF